MKLHRKPSMGRTAPVWRRVLWRLQAGTRPAAECHRCGARLWNLVPVMGWYSFDWDRLDWSPFCRNSNNRHIGINITYPKGTGK